MLRRTNLLAFVVVIAGLAAGGCPDRAELVDHVGGAPGRQVDDARQRAKAAEEKIRVKTNDAAAAGAVE